MPWRRTTIGLALALIAFNLWLLSLDDPGYAFELGLMVPLVFLLHIIVHELGHALVGALVGLRVERIVSGSGPRFLHVKTDEIDVEFRLLPTGGATFIGVHDPLAPGAHLARRFFLTIAGGPAATALLAFVLAEPLLGNFTNTMIQANGSPHSYDAAAFARSAGIWLLILNLVPFRGRDGAQLLMLLGAGPRHRRAAEQRIASGSYSLDVNDNTTDRVIDDCAARPALLENPYICMAHAVALLMEDRPDDARQTLELIASEEWPDDLRAIVPYTFAIAYLEADRERFRDEVDQWIQTTQWARGTNDPLTLVARARRSSGRGEYREALRLVQTGLDQSQPAGFDSKNLAFLHHAGAEAHRHAGDLGAALASIESARKLRPGHPMIERERVRIAKSHHAAQP